MVTPSAQTRNAVSLALLAIVSMAVGQRILLPGLDLDRLYWRGLDSEAVTRLSIFALGILPLYTVLACWEIAKLACPPLARWSNASDANSGLATLVLSALAIGLTIWQGREVLAAIHSADVVSYDAMPFAVAGLSSFVGVSVFLIWLAGRKSTGGPQAAWWLIFAIHYLAGMIYQLASWVGHVRVGAAPATSLLVIVAFIIAAVVMSVVANSLLRRDGGSTPSMLLWPPLVASLLSTHFYSLFAYVSPDWTMPWAGETVYLVTLVVVAPLMTWGYARLSSDPMPTADVLAIIAIQLFVCIGAVLLDFYLPAPIGLDGGVLIAISTVALAFARMLAPGLTTPPSR